MAAIILAGLLFIRSDIYDSSLYSWIKPYRKSFPRRFVARLRRMRQLRGPPDPWRPHRAPVTTVIVAGACATALACLLWEKLETWPRTDKISAISAVFSLGALVSALTFALFEQSRANGQEAERRARFIRVVVELVEPIARAGRQLLDQADPVSGSVDRDAYRAWAESMAVVEESLRMVTLTLPADAEVALATARLSAVLDPSLLRSPVSPEARAYFAKQRLAAVQEALGTLRRL